MLCTGGQVLNRQLWRISISRSNAPEVSLLYFRSSLHSYQISLFFCLGSFSLSSQGRAELLAPAPAVGIAGAPCSLELITKYDDSRGCFDCFSQVSGGLLFIFLMCSPIMRERLPGGAMNESISSLLVAPTAPATTSVSSSASSSARLTALRSFRSLRNCIPLLASSTCSVGFAAQLDAGGCAALIICAAQRCALLLATRTFFC